MFKFIRLIKGFGFNILPIFNRDYYVYSKSPYYLEPTLDFDMVDENKNSIDDIYVYGWVVEVRFKDISNKWTSHWNHKVYLSKEIAIDSINQSGILPINSKKIDYRIIPIYNFKNNSYRNYIINKIIEKK